MLLNANTLTETMLACLAGNLCLAGINAYHVHHRSLTAVTDGNVHSFAVRS